MTPRFLSRTSVQALLPSLLIVLAGAVLAGCGSGTVATIGDYSLSLEDYEKQFLRNNGGLDSARHATDRTKRDFLDLLIKYRLKVMDANSKGYASDKDILNELTEYRNSLAVPYLTERALIDPKVEELWKRRQEELRVAHILIRLVSDSTGRVDSVGALTQADRVLALAQSGARFDSLAMVYSQDPGTAKNGGDLQYFTAGMTAPSFDEAIYTLQPGQVYPGLVRTAFGYHIVKMLERHPSPGEFQVSHILVRIATDSTEDTTQAYAKVMAIMDTLRQGGDFATLAKMNSDDPASGNNGGDLGWVARRRFVPEFEAAVFSMHVGETRGPVRSPFGYHIIRVTGQRPDKPFEAQRQELKELYRRYGYDEDSKKFLAGIEHRYNVTVDPVAVSTLASEVDTVATTAVAAWSDSLPAATRAMKFVSLKGAELTVADLLSAVTRDRDFQSRPLTRSSITAMGADLGRKKALLLETADLEARYPEFADLMREYREGVLLFRAEQDAVWNRIAVKDEELKKYWEEHASEYRWTDRAQFREIFVTSDSLARVLRDSLNAGVDFAELASRHTQRPGYKEKGGDWGFQAPTVNELAKKALTMQRGWIEGPMKFQFGWSIIKVEAREAARDKTFEEARSEVSGKFQEYESKRLEREWIDTLRARYGVQVNEDVLARAFQSMKEGA